MDELTAAKRLLRDLADMGRTHALVDRKLVEDAWAAVDGERVQLRGRVCSLQAELRAARQHREEE